MIRQLQEKEVHFLQDREVVIVESYPPFSMALVKYIDSNECFIIDTDFLRNTPIDEEYIKIKFEREL